MAEQRLIDANALREYFGDVPPYIGMTSECVQMCIDEAPTIDAVEVVRCEYCEHAEECICVVCEDGETIVCSKNQRHMKKTDFCSYGERR